MDSVPSKKQSKPHAVCIPYPTQGHINPMLMMAKLLHHHGFHITFVNTIYNHKRLQKANGAASLESVPDFRFEKIHDGLPATDPDDATQDVFALCRSVVEYFVTPFKELVVELNEVSLKSGGEVPPVTCIVSDLFMPFASSVAEEFGIPGALFLVQGACGFSSVAHYPELVARGFFPLKDESYLTNGYLDTTTIDFMPGMRGICLRYLHTFFHTAKPEDILVKYNLLKLENALKATIIVANTFDALEHEVLEGLPALSSKILPIGPLHLLLNCNSKGSPVYTLDSNLWKYEYECVTWLDSREPQSVLYMNFGSIVGMTEPQFMEFAWGLANSRQSFLWVIRPDSVSSGEVVLPLEFLEETKGRGLLTGWCPQEQVLNHPSVGGFLTHCGWNSMVESISAGVPMICWPFFVDQMTNCWFACNKWGIGVELDTDVRRDEVEQLVRELMEGETGKDMHKRASEWKRLAQQAVGPYNSSSLNFERLVNELKKPVTDAAA